MNITVFDVYGFKACFGSAASAFENIELYSLCFKGEFQRYFEGLHVLCFTDLSRTTCALRGNYKHKV